MTIAPPKINGWNPKNDVVDDILVPFFKGISIQVSAVSFFG